jgi:hypothetical protein
MNRTFSKEVQTVNKYIKKCSTFLAIKEMLIKMTLKLHLQSEWLSSRKQPTNGDKDVGKRDPYILLVGMQTGPVTMEISTEAPPKAKNRTIIWSSILLLNIYPKECKSAYYRYNCTPTFIATPFTIAKLWNQPQCLSTDE